MIKTKSTSLQQELKIKITLLVVIPLIFSALYFSFTSYQQALELAQEDVERHADSIAIDLKNEFIKQAYSFSHLSSDPVLGEVAINILYSQYAFKKLNDIVEENATIEAAFISDGSEFIIEGYPLASLKLSYPTILNSANEIINNNDKKLKPKLIYLKDTPVELKQNSNGALFISFPLRKQLSSLIQPYKTTAVLYLMLSAEYILKTEDLAQGSVLKVQINNNNYFHLNKTVKPTLTTKRSVLSQDKDDISLNIEVSHLESFYTHKIYNSTLITISVIIVIFILLLLLLKVLTQGISQPLKKLEALSFRFASGNYAPSQEHFRYTELANLQTSLNTLAQTIVDQITNLSIAKKEAEDSEEIKTRFLANMSHEIRTPLNGITGLLQMIESEPLSNNQKQWLQDANLSSEILLQVVNDILDFSKIEQGKVTIEKVDSNLTAIFTNLQAIAKALIKDKNITFHLNNTLTHSYWKIDPTRLTQILVNLLSNAIKFTEHGEVKLICSTSLNQNNQAQLDFEVEDSGIGIEADQLADLFTSFKQADISTTRKYGGTGLGLSISQNLVKLMGGEIQVSSEVNKGTKFSFTIKADTADALEDKDQSAVISIPQLNHVKILIAEDNKINQTIIKHILVNTKAEIRIAENGIEAVALTKSFHPHLILMDVQMPEMDGIKATIKIRENGFTGPIIMQTANVMAQEVKSYLDNGATAHLAKPIAAEALYLQLNKYLIQS